MNIELKKLNKNYESDPNIAFPNVEVFEDQVKLTFELNYFTFSFNEEQRGEINFIKCHAFRVGAPNDEGFYLNSNSLWNKNNFPNLQWDCFYEVIGAPENYFDSFNKITTQSDSKNLHHYVFFMKEATFECLAESFKEIGFT